jgi:16S rRNA (cytosine1402-N4)-methyltransferase
MNETQKQLTHKSVLVHEVLDALALKNDGLYLDATFGLGGHTRAILDANPTCKVVALDWDKITLEPNAKKLKEVYGDRLTIIWGNFAQLYKILKTNKLKNFDGILADFGTSQVQIQTREGLSFNSNTPLDMRMSKGHHFFTAQYILDHYTHKGLASIFFELGEERYANDIAKAIIEMRKENPIKTTKQLADLVKRIYVRRCPTMRFTKHPATRTFQALRIYVNKELENIKSFLPAATQVLKEDGRLVCISFHSLEDRIIKEFFLSEPHLNPLSKKPIVPSAEEINENASSRSAKLRVAQKCQALR